MNTQTIPELRPDLAVINGKIKTTSLKIAEHFGKRHDHVLDKIRNLDCSPEFNAPNFGLVEYEDAKGEKRPAYEITRDGFMFLAMGFTDKAAAQWKEAYINAFNEMESELLDQPQNGLKQLPKRKPKKDDTLTITAIELAALVDQRVKEALSGRNIAIGCPKYHYPITDWQPVTRIGHTAYLTYQELERVDVMSRPLYRLLSKLQKDGHDIEGAYAEYGALKTLTCVFYQKLDSLKNIFETLDRYGQNIYLP